MKREHLKKASIVILKAKFVDYWKTVMVLIDNIAYDISRLVSKLFDVVKLILLLVFGFVAVPVMVFCSPVILLIYLPGALFFGLKRFKVYFDKGYMPSMHKLKTKVLPKRKKHQKYCIEKGIIVEYFINKRMISQRDEIADINIMLGAVDHSKIPKVHVLYLLTQLEEFDKTLRKDADPDPATPFTTIGRVSHGKNN